MSRLSSKIEHIVSILNSAPATTWTNLKVGASEFVEAEPSIDPEVYFKDERKGLFITPFVTEYSIEGSQGRQRIYKLNKQPVIAVVLFMPYETIPYNKNDVGTWEEGKKFLDLREDIEEYIATYPNIKLISMTATPPQELAMKQRWFLSVTEIQYEVFACAKDQ